MSKELDLVGFPSVSKEEWRILAQKQLKGEDPSTLDWQADQRLALGPYYDSSDLEGLEYLTSFFSKSKSFRWKLYEEILVDEDKSANHQALEALSGGCDGIIFKLEKDADPSHLLEGVLPDICDISIRVASDESKVDSIRNATGFQVGGENPNVYDATVSPSQVESIVQILNNISGETHILREADSDFFLEIATVRALRYLIFHVLERDPWAIHIHTTVPLHAKADHQWFLNSTAGLASILGGTNSIDFSTAEGNSRISRNVGNLIREESGISMYSDQCGGSYFVEKLTHMIVEEAKNQLNQGSNG